MALHVGVGGAWVGGIWVGVVWGGVGGGVGMEDRGGVGHRVGRRVVAGEGGHGSGEAGW